jgi:hypothetical protein
MARTHSDDKKPEATGLRGITAENRASLDLGVWLCKNSFHQLKKQPSGLADGCLNRSIKLSV